MKKSKELEKEMNKHSKEDSEKDLEETLEKDSSQKKHSDEKPEEELSKAEMNALIEEFTTKQNQRFLQFLRDQTFTSNQELSNDFLMKSLETDLDDAPRPQQNDKDKEELKYIKYESSEKSKYQSYSPIETQREKDPEFEKKSSSERILEEQKSFTKRSFGMKQFQEENSSGPEYLRPDDIKPDKARKYKVT
jgi:hypothetical protein